NVAGELNVASCAFLQKFQVRARAGNDQGLSDAVECLHGEVKPLERHRRRHNQVKASPVPVRRQAEKTRVDGWSDDLCGAAVAPRDAFLQMKGVGDEMVD